MASPSSIVWWSLFVVKINSQSLEDTQVEYISQKYSVVGLVFHKGEEQIS